MNGRTKLRTNISNMGTLPWNPEIGKMHQHQQREEEFFFLPLNTIFMWSRKQAAHTHTYKKPTQYTSTSNIIHPHTYGKYYYVESAFDPWSKHIYTHARMRGITRRIKKNNKNNNKSQNLIQKNRHIHTERNKEVLRYASFDSCVIFSFAVFGVVIVFKSE